MTINITDRDTGLPVHIGSTIKGMYGEPWIFLTMTSPVSVWLRDPITLEVVDLDPMTLMIDIDIRG